MVRRLCATLWLLPYLAASASTSDGSEDVCNYATIYDLAGPVIAEPLQVTSVNSIADCDQACCFFENCTGYGYKFPTNPSEPGICYVYGGGEWWTELGEAEEEKFWTGQNTHEYRKKMPDDYVATTADCPIESNCFLNTQADIFPLAFSAYCDEDPFFVQKEYVVEADKCVRGYGFSNTMTCVGPGKILWSKYNSYDTDCTGPLLHREVFSHPDLAYQCTRGLRTLHYTFGWGNYCMPGDDIEVIDVSELLQEPTMSDGIGNDEVTFEEFVRCADSQSLDSCLANSFCDWNWFKKECTQINLLVTTFEDDEGVAKGCAKDCTDDNLACQGKNPDGSEMEDPPEKILSDWDYAGIASCILEKTTKGEATEKCTDCIREGVRAGSFDFRCTYAKKRDCLAREWEECIWRDAACEWKETVADFKDGAKMGRCKKKNGRMTQCKKLDGCAWVEADSSCVPDVRVKPDEEEGRKCGYSVKSVKYGNAIKSEPFEANSACECEDGCMSKFPDSQLWRYKVATEVKKGECLCYTPPKDNYIFVESLKPTRKGSQTKYYVPVIKECFVDCPWMLDG